jgi:hypothetical protein
VDLVKKDFSIRGFIYCDGIDEFGVGGHHSAPKKGVTGITPDGSKEIDRGEIIAKDVLRRNIPGL